MLEDLRAKGAIGSGLNAEVSLYADSELASALAAPGSELRFWFITSGAQVAEAARRSAAAVEAKLETGETLWISAVASTHPKCERCWHQVADVGADPSHPTICGRCSLNVAGPGEVRRYI